MRNRSLLQKQLVSNVNNPHFAIVKYWDYFYLCEQQENKTSFYDDACVMHLKCIFEDWNMIAAHCVKNTYGCVDLQGEWYWEDKLTKYVKEFKKFEKYVVCLGLDDENFDSMWFWYTETCKYPFVTYSQAELQGWAVWYVNHLDEEYAGAKDFLFSVFKKYFDPDERLVFIRKKISGQLEWSFGLVDTAFENLQVEWLKESHQGVLLK